MRSQHDRASYAATYPTRELAEDAETLPRAATLARRRDAYVAETNQATPSSSPAPSPPPTPTPDEVRSSSAAAAESIDTILADDRHEHLHQAPEADVALTTGQAAVLPGVSRPTLVAWLEAGRIPFHRCGTQWRLNRSHVFAFREQTQRSSSRRQPSHELAPGREAVR